uniref:Uncharacterized protein n=1 Tax=Anguilla anguilla TaxID=7936 RepID=A0A0E9PJN6_ANGAN
MRMSADYRLQAAIMPHCVVSTYTL